MKPKYDLVKRTLPLTIIRPAEFYQHGDAVGASEGTTTDVAMKDGIPAGIDEADPPDTGGAAGSGGGSLLLTQTL